jgi:hypothetical protein
MSSQDRAAGRELPGSDVVVEAYKKATGGTPQIVMPLNSVRNHGHTEAQLLCWQCACANMFTALPTMHTEM